MGEGAVERCHWSDLFDIMIVITRSCHHSNTDRANDVIWNHIFIREQRRGLIPLLVPECRSYLVQDILEGFAVTARVLRLFDHEPQTSIISFISFTFHPINSLIYWLTKKLKAPKSIPESSGGLKNIWSCSAAARYNHRWDQLNRLITKF